ncbi:phage/plasmid primase, P4 family [Streptomyces sp. NPDC048192]|uniref:phage/plasmid primase, P4 family n=1 Tax=Streptomyces sp. NPDC048192 TaxID=3365510 RepID=UPI00371A7FA2
MPDLSGPYGQGVPAYVEQGWDGITPIHPGTKHPSMRDVTGYDGRQIDADEAVRLAGRLPYSRNNLALRMRKGMVGLDVDEHDDKHGAATIAAVEAICGPLPKGPYSSARGPGEHGIRPFHLPGEHRVLKGEVTAVIDGNSVSDVEIIQHHHRTMVVWPSVHPKTGTTYRWYDADGNLMDAPPRPEDCPVLPQAWADYLAEAKRSEAPYEPPVDKETGEVLEGFQGTPEGLRRHLERKLQTIRDLPVNGPGETPVNNIAFGLSKFVPLQLPEQELRTALYAAVRIWVKGHDRGYDGIEHGLRHIGTPEHRPKLWEERQMRPKDPEKYFARVEGTRTFLAATLATDVLGIGPLAAGIDSLLWEYREGVWVPSKDVARHRAASLLGENYRRSYAVNAEDVVRSRIPDIECEPIPEVINFRNGLYYWQTGMLVPHSPDVLSTVQLSVDWDPTAGCPEFDAFLGQVLHADTVDMMWELIGYLMYSGNPLHKAVMLTGSGRNGKGTFLRVLEALLGKQNISSASLTDLVTNRFATASLFGKIANIAGDIDGTYLETTGVFKNITGLDSIRAEHKGRDGFEFTPWAVPVFSANKIPGSADTTVGYLSRWVIQHFPHNFEGREDRTLDQRLQTKSELAGIAAKAVPALKRLMARGDFELSTSAQEAREEFIRRVDQVRTWISECTAPDPASWSPRTALYAVYKNWAARDGHGTLKATEFYDRLESAGVRPAKVNGNRGFAGIRVTDTAEGMGRPR